MRGFVVAADSGLPLRRAMIRAMASDGRGGGMTTTDADGRFEIKELPAGRYSLMATKAGYVSMQYGQRRPELHGSAATPGRRREQNDGDQRGAQDPHGSPR